MAVQNKRSEDTNNSKKKRTTYYRNYGIYLVISRSLGKKIQIRKRQEGRKLTEHPGGAE